MICIYVRRCTTSLFFRAENYSENNYNLHRPSYSSIAEPSMRVKIIVALDTSNFAFASLEVRFSNLNIMFYFLWHYSVNRLYMPHMKCSNQRCVRSYSVDFMLLFKLDWMS
jgi:hypothetical protein